MVIKMEKIDFKELNTLYSEFLNVFCYLYTPNGDDFDQPYEIKEPVLFINQNFLIIKCENKEINNPKSILTSFRIVNIDSYDIESVICSNIDEIFSYLSSNIKETGEIFSIFKRILSQMTISITSKYLAESVRQVIDKQFIEKIWFKFDQLINIYSEIIKSNKILEFDSIIAKNNNNFNPYLKEMIIIDRNKAITYSSEFSNSEGFINCLSFKIILLDSNKQDDIDYIYLYKHDSEPLKERMRNNPRNQGLINYVIEVIKNKLNLKEISITNIMINPSSLVRIILNNEIVFDIEVKDRDYIKIYSNYYEMQLIDMISFKDFKIKDIIPIYNEIWKEFPYQIDYQITPDPENDDESIAIILEKKYQDALNLFDIYQLGILSDKLSEELDSKFKYTTPKSTDLTANDTGIIFWYPLLDKVQFEKVIQIMRKIIVSCEENWVYKLNGDRVEYNNEKDSYSVGLDIEIPSLFVKDKLQIEYKIGLEFANVFIHSKLPLFMQFEITPSKDFNYEYFDNIISHEFTNLLVKKYSESISATGKNLKFNGDDYIALKINDSIIIDNIEIRKYLNEPLILEDNKPLLAIGFPKIKVNDIDQKEQLKQASDYYSTILDDKYLIYFIVHYQDNRIQSGFVSGILYSTGKRFKLIITDNVIIYDKNTQSFVNIPITPEQKDIIKDISKKQIIIPIYPSINIASFTGTLEEN